MWPERHPGLRGSRILSSPDRGAGHIRVRRCAISCMGRAIESAGLVELDEASCQLHGVFPSPQGGSLHNGVVVMGLRISAVAEGEEGTTSGAVLRILALRSLQDAPLPSSGQLEPAHHVVGEPDEVEMRSVLEEPDIADTVEAHQRLSVAMTPSTCARMGAINAL